MFKLMEVSFEQSTLATFGLTWSSFETRISVLVGLVCIATYLCKLWKKAYISVLVKRLRDIAFSRILGTLGDSASEFYKSNKLLSQVVNEITDKINNNQPLDPELVTSCVESYKNYQKAIEELLWEDLANFIRVYTRLNRFAPQSITMMFDDDAKELLTLTSHFAIDFTKHKQTLLSLEGGYNSRTVPFNELHKEIAVTYTDARQHLIKVSWLMDVILKKMEITLNIKKEDIK